MGTLLQPLLGGVFMGIGAGLLAYAYGDKIWGRRDKKHGEAKTVPADFYDPRHSGPTRKQVRVRRAFIAGIGVGLMFFFYFANR